MNFFTGSSSSVSVEVVAEVDTGAAAGASLVVGGVAEDVTSTTASVVAASPAIMELTTTTVTATAAFGDMGAGFAQGTAGMGIEERAATFGDAKMRM